MATKSGLGNCTLWGMTPAVNLLTFLDEKVWAEADDRKSINLLLFGQSDCRHVLKTLQEHLDFQAKKIKINIYIVESNVELYARQLLLLAVANIPQERLGLHEKTRCFMELYGNINVRPKTKTVLLRVAKELIKMVTNEENLRKQMPYVTISDLKFVERDALVEIFRYWTEYCDTRKEDLDSKWDKRLRYHLGSRYDSRAGAFDWDYHMRLMDLGADIISSAEYKRWRGSGMAFTDYDSEYSQPNVTMVSGASNVANWNSVGFLGEIITGPFIPFGIESEDKTLFEKANDQHKFCSGDVTASNLEKIFRTINQKPESSSVSSPSSSKNEAKGDAKKETKPNQSLLDCINITFLPMEATKFLHFKSQFLHKFHLAYFSSTMAQYLTPEMSQTFSEDVVVVVEGVRYFLELRKEHIEAYNQKVEELAEVAHLQKLPAHAELHADYFAYQKKPGSSLGEAEEGQEEMEEIFRSKKSSKSQREMGHGDEGSSSVTQRNEQVGEVQHRRRLSEGCDKGDGDAN